jgi:3-oxoacyl-[acyl-carrier protein] reductase
MNLSDKVILVTGGNKGIGGATVEALHAMGATIILHYNHDHQSAKNIVAKFNNQRIHLIQADLSIPGNASNLWEALFNFTIILTLLLTVLAQ